MHTAPLPHNEPERLLALQAYDILDTPRDPLFDGITELAAQICETPMALICLIDRERQWFKSSVGMGRISETPRDIAFCAHAILGDSLMEVPDTVHDQRFQHHPLVTAEHGIRFYAGMPLRDGQGLCLGTLCVIDRQPRRLSESQRSALELLSRLAMSLLEQRQVRQQALDMALARQQTDEKLAYLAQFDALTGLPNRHLFRDRMSQAIARAERSGHAIAVLVLNLDGFKLVNGNHGHAAGDSLLVQVAERLLACVRSDDSISRRGGDEFGIILSDLGRAEDTAAVVQKLLATLTRPFQVEGAEVFISACAGVSLYSADGTQADGLIKNAEIALQRAKEQGRNTHQFYAPEMNQRVEKRMRLESSLRHALSRGEFLLHYQPKLDIGCEQYGGAEALLRWNHPERGLVGPNEFIPILEDTGLILPVGLWVLETACAQMRTWESEGLHVPSIAVNLSARQFQQADLAARIRDIIESSGIAPGRIELEITESMLMHDPQQAVRTLASLKDLGVCLSVDDFGTGYSSLAYLKQFPLDSLKIDRAFISNITHDPNDAAITLTIINLAHNLNLKVVAEGVETESQARFLMEHGCDILQGYYFSRPLPADVFAALLKDGSHLRLSAPTATSNLVLLLDDNQDDLMLLSRNLANEGYEILTAETVEQAFEHLARRPVKLVIADQAMPRMNGVEFLSRVRHLYPDVIRIVRTGQDNLGVVADAINQASIHKFMSKHWNAQSERQTLRDAFQQSASSCGSSRNACD